MNKGRVVGYNEVVLDDFSTKFRVDILMDHPPKLDLSKEVIISQNG